MLLGSGSDSALPATKSMREPYRWPARSRPTPSIASLMSSTVTLVSGPPASSVRNAMSPVPPATSSSRNGRVREGRSVDTKALFQARCRPPDIRSFIRS